MIHSRAGLGTKLQAARVTKVSLDSMAPRSLPLQRCGYCHEASAGLKESFHTDLNFCEFISKKDARQQGFCKDDGKGEQGYTRY